MYYNPNAWNITAWKKYFIFFFFYMETCVLCNKIVNEIPSDFVQMGIADFVCDECCNNPPISNC